MADDNGDTPGPIRQFAVPSPSPKQPLSAAYNALGMQPIYLDNNATTPVLAEVAEAMHECYLAGYGNPASPHTAGRRARRLVEDARESIAQLLGAQTTGRDPDRVLFTSGGTEANNLAIQGLAMSARGVEPGAAAAQQPQIVISSIEHPSIERPALRLREYGWQVTRLEANADGVVCDTLLPQRPSQARIVSVMLANNETGVRQPVQALAGLCRQVDVPFHTDAIQAVGKVPINFRNLDVSTLSLAAHKFHGPQGIGALIVRGGTELTPAAQGGFQQYGLRPGTETVALVVGMRCALEAWHEQCRERLDRITALRDRFEGEILRGWPSAVVVGAQADRLPHTSNIAFVGLDRQALAMALDLAGVACSTGSACASGSSEPSPVLRAMGLPAGVIGGSVRFSFGALTSAAEIDQATARILTVCNDLRRRQTA